MSDDQQRDAGDAIRDGVRSISGILGALKDALEETFDDLRQSGELSPERAREAARSTMKKAQEAMEDVRGRLEFVPRREFDTLRREVDELRSRLEGLEQTGGPRAGASQATEAAPSAPASETPPMSAAAASDQPETGATEPTGEHEEPRNDQAGDARGEQRYRFEVE